MCENTLKVLIGCSFGADSGLSLLNLLLLLLLLLLTVVVLFKSRFLYHLFIICLIRILFTVIFSLHAACISSINATIGHASWAAKNWCRTHTLLLNEFL